MPGRRALSGCIVGFRESCFSEEVGDGIRAKIRPSAGAFHRLCAGVVPVDHAHGSRCGGGLLSSGRLLFRWTGATALGVTRPRGGASHSQLRRATRQADAFRRGLYIYTSRALGPKVGFLVGWAFLLAEPLVAPLLYLVFAATTADVFQNRLGINIPWWVWVLVAAGLVFYLTYWGIRLSTNAGIVLGIFEIVAFLALGLYMIFAAGDNNTLGVFNPANSLEGTWS